MSRFQRRQSRDTLPAHRHHDLAALRGVSDVGYIGRWQNDETPPWRGFR